MHAEPERTNRKRKNPEPTQKKSANSELLRPVKAVYRLLGRYLDMTFAEFQVGVLQDVHPETEVAIWCRIATVWYDYHERVLESERLSKVEEQKLLVALIAIFAGEKNVRRLPVPAEVGIRLLSCYDGVARA